MYLSMSIHDGSGIWQQKETHRVQIWWVLGVLESWDIGLGIVA